MCVYIYILINFKIYADVNVGINKADSTVAAKIEGLTMEGDMDTDHSVDGTQTSILPVELGDMDKPATKFPKKALRGNIYRTSFK